MLDIVAVLRWIRENVGQFGGDPSRVLVYGQSGGGAKTSVLLAMPSAKGLFHRAGVMSGSALRVMSPDAADAAAAKLMSALGVKSGELRKLQEVPFTTLLDTQATLEAADRAKGEAPRAFAPVLDGREIPRHPFDPDAPAVSADVPMIISTALDERTYRMVNFDLDEGGLLAFARKRLGDRASEAVRLYRAEDPLATPFILQARIDTDLGFRRNAFHQADRKAAAGGAKVWSYLWTWPSPAFGGRYGAVHGIDVAPSLHNIRGALNGPSASSLQMADRIASVWSAFAATGDPNNAHLPAWPAYTRERRQTLVLGEHPRVENDPRRAIRELLAAEKGPGEEG